MSFKLYGRIKGRVSVAAALGVAAARQAPIGMVVCTHTMSPKVATIPQLPQPYSKIPTTIPGPSPPHGMRYRAPQCTQLTSTRSPRICNPPLVPCISLHHGRFGTQIGGNLFAHVAQKFQDALVCSAPCTTTGPCPASVATLCLASSLGRPHFWSHIQQCS